MVKPVLGIVGRYPSKRRFQGIRQGLSGAGSGGAQARFEFTEGQFDRGKIWRVRRQVQQPRPTSLHQLSQPCRFVNPQVIEHDYVTWLQFGPSTCAILR